jgi:Zn-dependent protease
MGSIANIPVWLHPAFFSVLGMSALSSLSAGPAQLFLIALVYGPILLVTVVVHELGHALMTRHVGGSVECILLWPLGGLAMCSATSGPCDDLKVQSPKLFCTSLGTEYKEDLWCHYTLDS